jgi:hypothetical protein
MQVYSAPDELNKPKFEDFRNAAGRYDFETHFAAETEYAERVCAFAKKCGAHPLAGEVVRTPIADGYAEYVVAKISGKVSLIHIETGDAWRDSRFERLATVAELKRMVAGRKRMDALFGRSTLVAG